MKRLINILYSCAAGLEQACLTFETITQAHRAAVVMAVRNTPEVKQPIGFAGNVQANPEKTFTGDVS
tara:strand:- start:712 stop:912 length:201 start_codon:yes stop_codon:yes gene_type:complete